MNAFLNKTNRESQLKNRSLFPVLVIDDDPVFQTLISNYLVGTGYEVTVCDNVENGQLLLTEETFKLILCDWTLPGMSGIDWCKKLRKEEVEYHYFIFMTSKTSDDELVTGFKAGADDYIRKGARKTEVVARLDAGLRVLTLHRHMLHQQQEIERQTHTDALTDTYNRRFLMTTGNKEIKRSYRYRQPLSVIMCDIDNFKLINDNYGHLAGDEVLKSVAKTFCRYLRCDLDYVCRYGGEEFVILLPNTSSSRAENVAEKLRFAVESLNVSWQDSSIKVTCSFGICCTDRERPVSIESLLSLADLRLYQSKREGRNRVTS